MKMKRKRRTAPFVNQVSFTQRQDNSIPTEIENSSNVALEDLHKTMKSPHKEAMPGVKLGNLDHGYKNYHDHELADMALSEMEEGAYFVKVRSKNWKKTRRLELSQDHLSLEVSKESCGMKKIKHIDIKRISEIRIGHQSPIWEQLGKNTPDSEQCFSLVLENKNDPLNLIAVNSKSAQKWIRGLQHLNSNLENLDVKGKRLLWIWERFKEADKDENNLLSFKEVGRLLKTLNFEKTSNYVKQNLERFDASGDQHLSFDEFTEFFKKITWRPELERLYKTYCDADMKLQPSELRRFLRTDQGMDDVTEEIAKELIEKFEPDDTFKKDNVMSIYGFASFLESSTCDIFNPKHNEIYMDMTQPLSHYYIASSHNTYLCDDQLFGKSSVECYIRALERGCRCVELDCWDGEDDEPIIYHGYTLTSKIKFYDVIEAVRDYAFKVSDYPVTLSIENHCSIPQQTKMAEILKSLLGSKLLTCQVDPNETLLPSPESLKGKILVKGKRLPPGTSDDGDVSDEDEAADIEEDGVKKKQKTNARIKLSKALSNIVVYAVSRHFKSFADAEEKSDFRYISSLNEDRTNDLATDQPEAFIQHNQWQLVRIYPKGSRTNSSNYDPMTMWNVGCQIVALNYQTDGSETYLNETRFRTNGGCGYVLKPSCLLVNNNFNPFKVDKNSPCADPTEIQIRLISAQQLPKPPNNTKDVIDPYVIVTVLGCPVDKKSQKSSVIENNGFNPSWINDKAMKFVLLAPSLAFLEFKVMDKDSRGGDDLVGLYTISINDIATGYRHVHLETEGRQDLSPATLFVHVSITKDVPK